MYFRALAAATATATALLLFAGCQTTASRFSVDLETDYACVRSASYQRKSDTYTTDSCSRLTGDTEMGDDASYHELVIPAARLTNTIRIHEAIWQQQRTDLASGYSLESALVAATNAVDRRIADIWPEAPPLCWVITVLPRQARLESHFENSRKACIPLEVAVRFRGNRDANLGNLQFASRTLSTQLHETCHIMSALARDGASARNLDQRNLEEVVCNILGIWLDNYLLGSLFNGNIRTRYELSTSSGQVDLMWQELVAHSNDVDMRDWALPPLAEQLVLKRLCSDALDSTSPENEKLLLLFKQAYAYQGSLQSFAEQEFAANCPLVAETKLATP